MGDKIKDLKVYIKYLTIKLQLAYLELMEEEINEKKGGKTCHH